MHECVQKNVYFNIVVCIFMYISRCRCVLVLVCNLHTYYPYENYYWYAQEYKC